MKVSPGRLSVLAPAPLQQLDLSRGGNPEPPESEDRRTHRDIRDRLDHGLAAAGAQPRGDGRPDVSRLPNVARFLRRRLKLEVNAEKSQVAPTDKISFLGFSFRGAKICWPAKTLARFRREVKRLTNRNWGVSMRRRMTALERYPHLLKLGVCRTQAVSTGRSSHGPWHLARTEATQLALSNSWLARQGLVSFRGLWIALAHPR